MVVVVSPAAFAGKADAPQETFATPEAAVEALVAALKADDKAALGKVLGPDSADVIDSGDPIYDASLRQTFLDAYSKFHGLQADGQSRSILVIGTEDYPFPIPLVSEKGAWRFDTAAGADEILSRRIGENELYTIQVMQAFVDAQGDYASLDRDGLGPQYARKLLSTPGKQDGLYWDTSGGEAPSPMGPLVALARAEGYKPGEQNGEARAYHGYVFKMLTGQGPQAAGGARDYVVNGRMIGGFGLVATPAEYGNSGVMTFIVNQDGEVYERDLGPESRASVDKMRVFNPDKSWRQVQVE